MENKENHLTTEQLSDFLEGRLTPVEIEQAEAHLSTGCLMCISKLEKLEAIMGLMADDDWVSPPEKSRLQLVQAFQKTYRRSWTSTVFQGLSKLFSPQSPGFALGLALAVLIVVLGALLFRQVRSSTTVTEKPVAISIIEGTAEFRPSGQESWQALTTNTPVKTGDIVRTKKDSSIELSFLEGGKTRLTENTEIAIVSLPDEINNETQRIKLRQTAGQTYNHITLDSSISVFVIETAAAVVSVSGTEFNVTIESDGQTKVDVISGQLEVTGQDVTVLALAGQTTVVRPGQPPTILPATATVSPTASQTPAPSRIPNITPTMSSTPTANPKSTPILIPTITPSIVPSITPSIEPSITPTILPTSTPPFTPTPTILPTHQATPPIPSATATPIITSSPTMEPEETQEPEETDEPEGTQEPEENGRLEGTQAP